MKGSFVLLSVMLAAETLIAACLTGSLHGPMTLLGGLAGFSGLALLWRRLPERLIPPLGLALIAAGWWAYLPLGVAGALFNIALGWQAMAWMHGFRIVVSAKQERNESALDGLYNESVLAALVPAWLALQGDLLIRAPALGMLCGYFLLCLAPLFMEFARPRRNHCHPVLHHRLLRSAAFCALLLLLVSGALVVSTGLTQGAVAAWHRVQTHAQEEASASDPAGEGNEPSGAMIGYNEEPSLPSETSISENARDVMYLRFRDSADLQGLAAHRLYLRGSVYTEFAHQAWKPLPSPGEWIEDADDGRRDHMIELARPARSPVYYTVFLPRDPDQAEQTLFVLPGVARLGLGKIFRKTEDWYQLPVDGPDRLAYAAASDFTTLDLLQGQDLRAGRTHAACLRLDDPLKARITGLAAGLTAGRSGLYDRITACRDHLRDTFTYQLEIENRSGTAPLENFLFHERAGYCDFYASALTLMLRSQGIPARFASGYSGGTLHPDQGIISISSNNAHSWTEVFLERHGWVVVDATPPSHNRTGDGPGGDAPDQPDLAGFEQAAGDSGIEDPGFTVPTLPAWLRWIPVFIIGLGSAALCAGFLVFVLRRRREEQLATVPAQARPDQQFSREFYARVCEQLSETGAVRGRGDTPVEFLQALARLGFNDPLLDEITRYHYRVQYEEQARSPEQERAYLEQVERLVEDRRG